MPHIHKTVLVTGASKGIGRAIALTIAKSGYTVVVHYNSDHEGAHQTLQEIINLGGQGRLICFDVSDRITVQDTLEADMAAHGAYYGVILNAGIARDTAFPAMEEDDWNRVIHTNLDGFYNVIKPVVMPMVRAKKPARIVTISSVSGIAGNRGQVNYSAAKAGIIGATKALALELASRNITVNCVAPGVIKTQMTEGLPLEEVMSMIPMRRIGQPEEVAATVGFLLSESAAYITRQVISVNGGLV